MSQTTIIRIKAALLLVALAIGGTCHGADADHAYVTGYGAALKLSVDLHDALPQKFFDQVDVQTIPMQSGLVPLISPVAVTADNRLQRQIQFSAGFVELVNRLCHAKAIEKVQAGYFDRYVGQVAHAYSTVPPGPIPAIVEPRFWTEDVMNDQSGYFNQMMGMIMAINMSHHYLGYYAKYAAKLAGPGNKAAPINNFLTDSEWDVAVKAGVLDALNCALSTAGLQILFEALDKMPTRPAWAAYIVPPKADLKKLNALLAGFEEDFYHGRIKN